MSGGKHQVSAVDLQLQTGQTAMLAAGDGGQTEPDDGLGDTLPQERDAELVRDPPGCPIALEIR